MSLEISVIEIDDTSDSNEEWKEIMSVKLENALHFEIENVKLVS